MCQVLKCKLRPKQRGKGREYSLKVYTSENNEAVTICLEVEIARNLHNKYKIT